MLDDDYEDATEVYGDWSMSVPAKKDINPVQSAPTVPTVESTALISMIERAARDPAVDMDKLERLVLMQERVFQRNAEQAFNDAMAAAQGEMRRVAVDSINPQTKSKYASYGALDKSMRPIYTRHGFALSFGTSEGAPQDYIRVECHVSNNGFTRKYQVDMPADGKGAKGGDVMTKTHAVGSAMSYGQRYLLKLIFNIAVGTDDDGNAASDTGELVNADQAEEIKALIVTVGADIQKFLTAFQIEKVEDLRLSRFAEAKTRLNRFGKGAK